MSSFGAVSYGINRHATIFDPPEVIANGPAIARNRFCVLPHRSGMILMASDSRHVIAFDALF